MIIFNNAKTGVSRLVSQDYFYPINDETKKVTLYSLARMAKSEEQRLKMEDGSLAFKLIEDPKLCLLGSGWFGSSYEKDFLKNSQILQITPADGIIIDHETL